MIYNCAKVYLRKLASMHLANLQTELFEPNTCNHPALPSRRSTRKMHLDERWILKAAPRRSMLPDAFSRPRKMHLDEWWILKAAMRFPGPEKCIWASKGFSRQLLEGARSQMRFPGPEKCIYTSRSFRSYAHFRSWPRTMVFSKNES